MTRIICEEDCGNAPKKLLLKNFNAAFARSETDVILEHVADDITWNMVGELF